ncbi:unnamed protein product [Fusarium langsethiae]|nr:unnamed protein product [Fusarium langsethiae]
MAKSSSTPQHSSMTSSPHDVVSMGQLVHNSSLPHASSYADFESPVHGHHMPPHYAHRHGIPTTVPYKYHGHTVPGQQAHDQIVRLAVHSISIHAASLRMDGRPFRPILDGMDGNGR